MSNKYNSSISYIVLSGIMLSITLLFDYLSKFMPIVPNIMHVNLSLIPILITFIMINWKYGVMLLISRYLLSFAFTTMPLGAAAWGNILGALSATIYILLFLLFRKLKLFKSKYAITTSLIIISIIASIIMSIFNAILGIPIFNLALTGEYSFTISNTWNMDNYLLIVITVFMVGNIINFAIASFIIRLLLPFIKKTSDQYT